MFKKVKSWIAAIVIGSSLLLLAILRLAKEPIRADYMVVDITSSDCVLYVFPLPTETRGVLTHLGRQEYEASGDAEIITAGHVIAIKGGAISMDGKSWEKFRVGYVKNGKVYPGLSPSFEAHTPLDFLVDLFRK